MRSLSILTVTVVMSATGALAQGVPVRDQAVLNKTTEIARTTDSILSTDRNILGEVQSINKAVNGDRTSDAQGQFAQAALGQGFSMSQAPDLGAMLAGGTMSWGKLTGLSQSNASNLINALALIPTLTEGLGKKSSGDQLYGNAVNLNTGLIGMAAAQQAATQQRVRALQTLSQQIGTAQTVKGSVDQNTQVSLQLSGLINELIGTTGALLSSQVSQEMQQLNARSEAARTLTYDADKGVFVNSTGSQTDADATITPRYAN